MVLILCYSAAYRIRVWMWRAGYPVLPIERASTHSWVIIVAFVGWIIAERYFGLYDPITYKSVSRVLSTSFKAQMLAAVLMVNTIFVLRGLRGISRPLLALLLVLSLLSSAVEKLIVVMVIRNRWRLQGPTTAWRVLLVGNQEEIQSYLDLVREHPEWSQEIVDVISVVPKRTAPMIGRGGLPPSNN